MAAPSRARRVSAGDQGFDIASLSPVERKALATFNPTLGNTLSLDSKDHRSRSSAAWDRVAADLQKERDIPDLEPSRSFVTRTTALNGENRSRGSRYKVTMLDRHSEQAGKLLGSKPASRRVKGKRSRCESFFLILACSPCICSGPHRRAAPITELLACLQRDYH